MGGGISGKKHSKMLTFDIISGVWDYWWFRSLFFSWIFQGSKISIFFFFNHGWNESYYANRLVQEEQKMKQSQTSLLIRQAGEGEACGWPTAGTVGCLAMEPSLAWASNVPSSRQNTHLLSLSVARSGHVMCFWPVRHEQNSTQDCGKQLVLCFPFIPALKMYMMPGAGVAIFQLQGKGWRITMMSALILSHWTITSKHLPMLSYYVRKIPLSVFERLWVGFSVNCNGIFNNLEEMTKIYH